MSGFDEDCRELTAAQPDWLISLEPSSYNIEVVMTTPGNAAPGSYTIMLPDGFRARYPASEVSVTIGGDYEELRPGRLREILAQLRDKVARREATRQERGSSDGDCDSAESSSDQGMGGDGMERQDSSWGIAGCPDESALPTDPAFLEDVRKARRKFGDDILSFEEHKFLDDVIASLRISLDSLDPGVCRAWGLAPRSYHSPLVVRLTMSRTGYRTTSKCKVECFQEGSTGAGLVGQIQRVVQAMANAVYRPGAGGAAGAAPHVQRGYRSDGAAGAGPPAPAAPPAFDYKQPRPQLTGPASKRAALQPAAGRGDSAAAAAGSAGSKKRRGGPEPRRGSGHAAARRAVSDSPPSAALRQLVEMGFDQHRARVALKQNKDDVAAAALLLSMASAEDALIGDEAMTAAGLEERAEGAPPPAPAPAAAAPGAQAHTYNEHMSRMSVNEKQALPPETDGFLVRVIEYVQRRIPTCSEFCVICDRPHVFASGAMLRMSVCARDVCAFSFQQLGVGAEAAQEVATDSGVVDLLVCMAKTAAHSTRWDDIFDPYPTVFDPEDNQRKVLDAAHKDIDKVRSIFKAFPAIRELSNTDDAVDMKKRMDTSNRWAHPLLTWIIASNRSQLVKMRDRTVEDMRTPHQYLLLSANPEKQARFDALKRDHPTKFAFHGSSVENWHSILRNGLYNASGTKYQLNGAAHGAGIYLSPDATVSFGYSALAPVMHSSGSAAQQKQKPHQLEYITEGSQMRCIAICEVSEHELRQSHGIWVQPNADAVVTRFLFVYDCHHQPCPIVIDADLEFKLKNVCQYYSAQ